MKSSSALINPAVRFCLAVALASCSMVASAQISDKGNPERACKEGDLGKECGFFWGAGLGEEKEEEEEVFVIPKPTPTPTPAPAPPDPEPEQQLVENICENPKTWVAPCGFIDPEQDWDFQSRMGEELAKQMAMNSTDAKAVKEYQKYAFWVVRQASQTAKMWMYNLSQDPDLNPAMAHYPISQFGIEMAAKGRKAYMGEIYQTLKEDGAFFVYFSKNDCMYCHKIKSSLRTLEQQSGLPIYNAALDNQCIDGYEGEYCLSGKETHDPAAMLNVRVVPAVFLYMPKEKNWIRIATGLEDAETMNLRIRLFGMASRAAAIKGMESSVDGQAAVDFTVQSYEMGNTGSAKVE